MVNVIKIIIIIVSCGHTQPDNQKTSYLAMPDFKKKKLDYFKFRS